MYRFVPPRQTLRQAFVFLLRRVVLRTLLIGLCFLMAMPGLTLGQEYPQLLVPENYRGPSGEPGQIMLEGIVKKIGLFHGRVQDEADWHVHIELLPKTKQDLQTFLWSRGYTFISSKDCDGEENCNLKDIYSEVMVCDRHNSTSLISDILSIGLIADEYFYSADFTLPFFLSQPPLDKGPIVLLPDGTIRSDPDWTGEHPAWDLGLIAINDQGSEIDFSDYSRLDGGPGNFDGGRAYLQGAFVEDAQHRICSPPYDPTSNNSRLCYMAPLKYVKSSYIEIHPLDSIAVAMNEAGTVLSAKRGQQGWPTNAVKWRVAFFANSKFHRINGESYLKKERTTTWYLDLPNDAYNSWGDEHIEVHVEEEPQRLWDGGNKTWYFERGVKSYAAWTLAVDPKDGRKKLKVSVTMSEPNNRGGIVVRDYIIHVKLHSSPDLCIRASNSNYGDAQCSPWATVEQGVSNGAEAVYYVRGQNQGPVPIQFRFAGIPGSSNWTIRYFDARIGGNDITAQMIGTGSGWLSPFITGGATTEEIRVEVTPSASLPDGSKKEVVVVAASSVEPDRADYVKAVTRVGKLAPPIK